MCMYFNKIFGGQVPKYAGQNSEFGRMMINHSTLEYIT